MVAPAPRTGNPTVRNGLIFGAVLGLLGLGNSLAQALTGTYHVVTNTAANGVSSWAVTTSGPTVPLGCVLFLAMLALTFGAGLLAARGNGRVGSGALAGLLAGIIGGLIGGLGNVVVLVLLVAPSLQIPPGSSLTLGQAQALLVGTSAFGDVVGLLAGAGFGAGLGALGGLLGANSYRRVHPPAPFYPGYPSMPPYPSYPGVPAQLGSMPPQPWAYPSYPPPAYPYPTPSEQPPRPDTDAPPLPPQ